MAENKARKMLRGIVGTRDETPDDVVKSMLDYAEYMRLRQKDAVEGDKALPCGAVALRMEDTAARIKAALRRERTNARWLQEPKKPCTKMALPTKKLAKETHRFLGYLDLMLQHEARKELRSVIKRNGLDSLLAGWNAWWKQERRRRNVAG